MCTHQAQKIKVEPFQPAPVTQTRGPVEATPVAEVQGGEAGGSSTSGGVIAGIVLVIAGALAALFGWWYNNGGQFPMPF